MCMDRQITHSNQKSHTTKIPFKSDAKRRCGGLRKLENDCCVDRDEHFKREGQLDLSKPTGDEQCSGPRGGQYSRVVTPTETA